MYACLENMFDADEQLNQVKHPSWDHQAQDASKQNSDASVARAGDSQDDDIGLSGAASTEEDGGNAGVSEVNIRHAQKYALKARSHQYVNDTPLLYPLGTVTVHKNVTDRFHGVLYAASRLKISTNTRGGELEINHTEQSQAV